MKFLAIFAIYLCVPIVFAIFSEKINDYLHNIEEDCAKKSGVDFVDIEVVRKTHIVPDNGKMNKFAQCMMQKYKVVNADGTVNPDIETYEILTDTPNIMLEAAIKCKTESGRDDTDTARKIMNCFLKKYQIILAFTPLKLKN